MVARVSILLGRTIWIRGDGGWSYESFEPTNPLPETAIMRLMEILSMRSPRRKILIFEPCGMVHQTVETPNVGRAVFASLARTRDEFPEISSGEIGWGIDYPESTQGGRFTTTVHAEAAPGLALLRDRCHQAGFQLPPIWCAHTVAGTLPGVGSSTDKARFLIIMLPGFVAVASFSGGKRHFKAWTDIMSGRDWKALAAVLGEFDSRPAGTMDDVELRRGLIKILAQGKPEQVCPIWEEINRSGRVSSIVDLDALAAGAETLSPRHPGNLSKSFSQHGSVSFYVWILGIAALIATALLGTADVRGKQQLRAEEGSNEAQVADEQLHLAELKRNQAVMGRLQRELPTRLNYNAANRYAALASLSKALPDYLTLKSVSMVGQGSFELEAIVSVKDFDPEDTRKRLESEGFETDAKKGCVFDPAFSSLLVRGTFVYTKK